MRGTTQRRRISRVVDGVVSWRSDTMITEEPLEIRLGGKPLVVTMRTPGSDFDLTAGFLVSEGVVSRREEIRAIRYCAGAEADGANTYNIVDVDLAPGVRLPDFALERSFYTTSSCGLCGKASLDAVRTTASWEVDGHEARFDPKIVASFPDRLREAQRLFDRTGGLHAAGLFRPDGGLLLLHETIPACAIGRCKLGVVCPCRVGPFGRRLSRGGRRTKRIAGCEVWRDLSGLPSPRKSVKGDEPHGSSVRLGGVRLCVRRSPPSPVRSESHEDGADPPDFGGGSHRAGLRPRTPGPHGRRR